jgi:hypothetical protein
MTDYDEISNNEVLDVEPENEEVVGHIVEEEEVTVPEKPKKKEGLVTRAIALFLGTDGVKAAIKNASDKAWEEVIKPKLYEVTADALHSMVDNVVYRDGGVRRYSSGSSGNYGSGKKAYDKMYRESDDDVVVHSKETKTAVKPIGFPTREKALYVLKELDEQIYEYGIAKVSDLYELCGIDVQFVNYSYGWRDISNATVLRSSESGEWILRMPTPIKV